jgi:dephospho-CoA kinase
MEAIKDLGIIVTMGDVVRNEVKIRNLEPTGNNIGKIAKVLREKNGPAIIAEKCVELIKKKNEEIIFVDGVRSISEVMVFRKYWKFPIISILVDEEKRFKHLFERNRSDDPKSLEDLKERDRREIEFGLDKVLEIAEYRIYNNSSIEDLEKKIRKTVLGIIQN